MPKHDSSYRKLFSLPRMVKDLITGFIHEDWVLELNFDQMEAVETSFVSEALQNREADIIWRIQWRQRWLYVYVLIEMQSTIDPIMPVRLMTYIGLLYQNLANQKQLTPEGLLPPVLPITLYNGSKPWLAATKLADLVAATPNSLNKYQPQFEFFLLDEGRYSNDTLPKAPNLVRSLVNMENSSNAQGLKDALSELIEAVSQDTPEYRKLRRTFAVWLARSLLPGRFKGVNLPKMQDLSEVQNMLSERVVEWTQEWYQKGKLDGKEEGIEEGVERGIERGIDLGIEKGKLATAEGMLNEGLPLELIQKITGFSLETLERLKH